MSTNLDSAGEGQLLWQNVAVDSSLGSKGPKQGYQVSYWLDYNGRVVTLIPGTTVIGRGAGSGLVLDDALVSRRHAQITVSENQALLEDLGSVNGVFVNGERIEKPRVLADRDRITIGKQDLLLRVSGDLKGRSQAAPTLHGASHRSLATTQQKPEPIEGQPDSESEKTVGGEALELLGGVAEKVLTLGRGDEAERLLQACLLSILDKARIHGGQGRSNLDEAARFAVKLAEATGKARWVNYTLELFILAARPLPAPVVEGLYTVIRRVIGVDRALLREYLTVLRQNQQSFGPTERFLHQRIEGLEQIVR